MSCPSQCQKLVLEEPHKFVFSQCDVPQPSAGEVLVRVGYVGVCGTDFHAYHGRQNFFTYPRCLGHELGVTVVAVGPGTENCDLVPGDKCSVEPYVNCENCIACKQGKGNCCTNISVLGVHADGGMAEFALIPARKLHASQHLSLSQLALVETLCIGAHAVHRAGVKEGENVLVIGAGPVGMAVSQFAMAAAGSAGRVVVLDIFDNRLKFIREQVGVKYTLNPRSLPPLSTAAAAAAASGGESQLPAAVRELCGGDLPVAVIDATGNIHSMQGAFECVAHGGRLTFVGHTKEEVKFQNPLFHSREMTVLASRNALGEDFRRVISLIERGVVDVRPWITHSCSLPELPASLLEWMKPDSGVIKAVVQMDQLAPPALQQQQQQARL